ncbi:MAG TPA: PD-(D/E)XK nuclease family protein [Chthoniobacterales bacterium]
MKETSLRDQGFRPSNFPKLEECLHFVGRSFPEGETTRGLHWHELLEQVLKEQLRVDQIDDGEAREAVAWAVGEINQRGIVIRGVEETVLVTGEDGVEITRGVVDAWGNGPENLWGIDFKTGDQRDYSAQFAAYSGALMARENVGHCAWLELYLDLRVASEYEVDAGSAQERINELQARFERRAEEAPLANPYCDWCAVRGTCPVWLEAASDALAVGAPAVPDEAPVNRLVYEIERLKQDPVELGHFYTAYRRLEKLVEDDWQLKDKIAEYLEQGREVPGFCLRRSPTQESVEVEEVVLKCVLPMGSVRAREFLSVSVPRLRQEWARFSSDPFPVTVEQSPPAYHVRQDAPKGRGRAAAARARRGKAMALKGASDAV